MEATPLVKCQFCANVGKYRVKSNMKWYPSLYMCDECFAKKGKCEDCGHRGAIKADYIDRLFWESRGFEISLTCLYHVGQKRTLADENPGQAKKPARGKGSRYKPPTCAEIDTRIQALETDFENRLKKVERILAARKSESSESESSVSSSCCCEERPCKDYNKCDCSSCHEYG